MRIPIVLIGTPAATRVLGGEFRQARRGSSQGDLIWDRLVAGQVWDLFCASLQRYQYTRTPHTLLGPLGDVLLRLSDGIIDVAIAIYKRGQIRTMEAGDDEVLTVDILRRAAEEDFQQVSALIRSRQQGLMNRMPGAHIDDIDDVRPVFGAPGRNIATAATQAPPDIGEAADVAEATTPIRSRAQRTKRLRVAPGERGFLPSLGVAATTQRLTIYEALRQAKLIKSATPFLDGTIAA